MYRRMSKSGSNQPEPITIDFPSSTKPGPPLKKVKGKGKKKETTKNKAE